MNQVVEYGSLPCVTAVARSCPLMCMVCRRLITPDLLPAAVQETPAGRKAAHREGKLRMKQEKLQRENACKKVANKQLGASDGIDRDALNTEALLLRKLPGSKTPFLAKVEYPADVQRVGVTDLHDGTP